MNWKSFAVNEMCHCALCYSDGWLGQVTTSGAMGGYKGVPWIHQAKFNKTQADREVSATWCDRQRKEVDRQVTLLGGLKGSDSRIADILML